MVHHKHLLVNAESRLEPTVSLVSCESVGLLKTAVSLTIASQQFVCSFFVRFIIVIIVGTAIFLF